MFVNSKYFQILNKIFSKLDLHTIKLVRFVSQEWSEIGASCIGRQIILDPYDVFLPKSSELVENPGTVFTFNPRLARRINMHDSYYWPARKPHNLPVDKIAAMLSLFSTHINQFTTQVEFFVQKATCQKYVTALLTRNEFPCLKSISVTVEEDVFHVIDDEYRMEIDPLPVRPSIKSITYKLDPLVNCIVANTFPFRGVFNAMLASAPNLQKVSIVDNFYPNLENCRALDSLKLVGSLITQKPLVGLHGLGGYSYIFGKDDAFEEKKFLRTILQVQKTLRHLVIGAGPEDTPFGWNPSSIPDTATDYRLPLLPNLESLEILGFGCFDKIGETLNSIILPRMKYISLVETELGSTTMDQILAKVKPDNRAVEELSLQFLRDPEAFHRFGVLWPNVKKLTVSFKGKYRLAASLNYAVIIQSLSNCWDKLDQFHVKLQLSCYEWGTFCSEAVKSLAKFSGVKSIDVQSSVIPDFYYREAAVYPVDWDFLLLTKTFNSFTFRDTEFTIPTLEGIVRLREAHQLPIQFNKCQASRQGFSWATTLTIPLDKWVDF
ncbi:uncharacterized protein LOC118435671 [Folsomia candida]|uniref:uncharacterized protein LOC118435671 n=1 Tax=Folsomia candida TaxID=158441 RepID=UPI0016050345|nr:uncharacterized protein LOC118435671 [Folsomia candida]